MKFTIPVPPVTKKNSQRIIVAGGRPRIIPSKAFVDYEIEASYYLKRIKRITGMVNLKCVYYMPTRRKVDLVNLLEATCDLLVTCGILEDDNCQIVVSHDGSRVLYDKDNPRTEVEITAVEE